jgi:DNA-binding NarL/FixJ family response regulator
MPSGQETVTVVLAERHRLTRTSLIRSLEEHGFSVVAEPTNAEEAVSAALEHNPDLCVIDGSLPGGGLEAARSIASGVPDTKIAMLADSLEGDELVSAIRAGAVGYVPKANAHDALALALQALLRDEAAVPRALSGRLVSELRGDSVAQTRIPAEFPTYERSSPSIADRPSRLQYLPRWLFHYRRRRRGGMSIARAWRSASERMSDYL